MHSVTIGTRATRVEAPRLLHQRRLTISNEGINMHDEPRQPHALPLMGLTPMTTRIVWTIRLLLPGRPLPFRMMPLIAFDEIGTMVNVHNDGGDYDDRMAAGIGVFRNARNFWKNKFTARAPESRRQRTWITGGGEQRIAAPNGTESGNEIKMVHAFLACRVVNSHVTDTPKSFEGSGWK